MTQPGDDHPLYTAIHRKLAEIVAAAPTPPSWYDAWTRLGPELSNADRLAVYRAVRESNDVPAEAGFFLVARLLDDLTDERAEEGMLKSDERLEAIREKYGLEEDTPADADGVPDEYREALEQSHDAWDALYLQTLETFGEPEMAQLFRDDEEEFDRRYEAGRQFFHGTEDDTEDWLDLLLETVAACVESDSPMGPLGVRYQEDDGYWQVWIYPMPVELVGGAHDGAVVVPGFRLDLEQFRETFDSIEAFGWNTLGFVASEGPHVYAEGVFHGREVYLQVLSHTPEGEQPGLKLDTTPRRRG